MSKKKNNRENKLVFRVITPTKLINVNDLKDVDDILSVEVVDFKTGKKLGVFTLGVAKLKFF